MAAKARVGFIGVGFMGHGLAKNIVEKGHALTIRGQRNRKPVEDLLQRGAKEAANPAEVAAASDIVFLCVTGSPQVEALVRSERGLAAGARMRQSDLPSIIADCSTAEPTSTMALAAELAPQGVHFVDAPLGGTPSGAWDGKLSTMIGAEPAIFERVQRVAACFAVKIEHIGEVGDGHKMKLLNNFLSLGYGAIYSEALA